MIRNKPYSECIGFHFVPPNERGQNGRAGRAGLTSFVLLVGSMTTAVLQKVQSNGTNKSLAAYLLILSSSGTRATPVMPLTTPREHNEIVVAAPPRGTFP